MYIYYRWACCSSKKLLKDPSLWTKCSEVISLIIRVGSYFLICRNCGKVGWRLHEIISVGSDMKCPIFYSLKKKNSMYIQYSSLYSSPFPNHPNFDIFLSHLTTTTGVVFQHVVVPLNLSLLLFHDPVHHLLFISPFLLSLFRDQKNNNNNNK